MEIKEEVKVTDLHGSPIGTMDIAIQPRADDKGRPLSPSEVVDSPEQLIGRKVYFEFRISGCRALPPKFKVYYTFLLRILLCYKLSKYNSNFIGYSLQISLLRGQI